MTIQNPSTIPPALQRTPLYDEHRALNARLVEFGGWEMPVQYSSIIDEHRAVRTTAGLFDVCHMGEFYVNGLGALDFLEGLVPNYVGKLVEGQALYTQICKPDGGTLDDLLIYNLAPDHYMIVVNASTQEKDWQWFTQHAAGRGDITFDNASDRTALIAIQGPRAQDILAKLTNVNLDSIRYYHARSGTVANIPCLISRTGYTGEEGFELYHPAEQARTMWHALLNAGKPYNIKPAGLGARDTLRLEAGMCLYGHELDETISPLEAELGWSVRLKKGHDFIGCEALTAQKASGIARIRVGLKINSRIVARAGSVILHDGQPIGSLTSGTMSITLGYPIAMGYIPPDYAIPGTSLMVDVRGKHLPAEVVTLPFYKRA
jgi:aminomethyltransferase